MMTLDPATTLWICSYLDNRSRLRLGSCAQEFYELLSPLFKSLACDFLYKNNLKLAHKEFSDFTYNKTLLTMDGDDFGREYDLGKKSGRCKTEQLISNFWKTINEKRLKNSYSPALIESYEQAKKMFDEKEQLDSLLKKFGVSTPEEALRHAAAKKDSINGHEFKFLCDQVGDINQPSNNGNTALHWALKVQNENFAHLLLERGASCKAINKRGETPLHFAALLNSDNLAGKLIARGAYLNARDNDGHTPLDKAIRYKKQACMALLKEKSKAL